MSRLQAAPTRNRQERWLWVLLIVLPLLAYARLAGDGFVWDDDSMAAANPLVRAGDGLWRIWFTTQATDYWPVTFTSFWAEWRLWGAWAPGYHLTNVLLHVGEGVLLWRLLLRVGIPGAFFAALWFALHPLNVESVAWIAQRKNLLAMLFFLLSLRAFAESSVLESGRMDRWCGLAWGAFLLAMLSKGSASPLPFVLAGWVLWRRRLHRKDLPWLGIFFLTAAILVAANLWFSHKSGGGFIRAVGWPDRIAGAAGAFWFYLGKVFWPFGLCFVYPGWTVPPQHPLWWWGLGLAVATTAGLWLGRRRGARPELAAWLYLAVMLLPVLGLVDVYFMRYSLVADHYAHLALVGALAWAAARFTQLKAPPAAAWIVAGGLGLLTFSQAGIYRDNDTLFRSVLALNPGSWMAHSNLGYFLEMSGHPDQAVAEYQAAIALKPDYPEVHNNLGSAWSKLPGRQAEAAAELQTALRLKPDYAEAHYNLANVWLQMPGRLDDAIAEYQAAVRLAPDFADAHYNLGNAWFGQPGRLADAIGQFKETIRLDPNFAEAHCNLGSAWMNEPGHLADAIGELRTAIRLKPDFAQAHYNLGNAWSTLPGHGQDAIAEYRTALRLRPDVAAIHFSLAIALLNGSPARTGEAAAELGLVLRLQPDNAEARRILGQIRAGGP